MSSERDTSTAIAAPPAASAERAARYRVTVVEAIDAADVGKTMDLDGAEPQRVLVGQGPSCALRVGDPTVSRRHAALEVTSAGLAVTDLHSKNGTTINGIRAAEVWLQGGESILLGATRLSVTRLADDLPIAIATAQRFGRVLGASPAMRKLYPLLTRIAAAHVPVILEGETGTGKELLAEAIHEEGPRSKQPFVVFDCTAVSPSLIESALFGHEKGAFTGAVSARRGVFEQADGGTLLIDELGDLDLPLQAKLLRAIERSEVQRVGGERWLRVDVRVLAATRRDLDAEVHARRFREDLFFRLNVARAELPPLRLRDGDVGLLARHFWRELGDDGTSLPADFLPRFESYAWPGNVRELYNVVARRRALGELDTYASGGLRPATETTSTASGAPTDRAEEILAQDLPFIRARDQVVEDFERRYVQRALARWGGNASKAAAASGIARRYFYDIKRRSET